MRSMGILTVVLSWVITPCLLGSVLRQLCEVPYPVICTRTSPRMTPHSCPVEMPCIFCSPLLLFALVTLGKT